MGHRSKWGLHGAAPAQIHMLQIYLQFISLSSVPTFNAPQTRRHVNRPEIWGRQNVTHGTAILLSLSDIKWLQSITNLPILVKGILTAEDAELAIQAGAAGIVVSNHGARQLDHVPATIDVLEEVVQAVQGRVPVLVDGGIRRGTDIFKALALGAQAVLVGRPIIFGLAVKGESGVKKVLQMLFEELELTMSLAGCRALKDISRSHVQTERDRIRSML